MIGKQTRSVRTESVPANVPSSLDHPAPGDLDMLQDFSMNGFAGQIHDHSHASLVCQGDSYSSLPQSCINAA